MTNVVKLPGDYEAHLDPLSGLGMLVMPHPVGVLVPAGDGTLSDFTTTGWNAAMRELGAMGWDFARDRDGTWIPEGVTGDGRDVIALSADEPIHDDADFRAWAVVIADLRKSVGMDESS